MEEIKRMQQLAGLLNEIKVQNPMDRFGGLSMEDFLDYKDRAEEEFNNYSENISEEEQDEFDNYNNQVYNSDKIKDIDEALLWLYSGDEETLNNFKNKLDEDVSGFNIGQTKQSDGHKSTVTDVDKTTQSVTWNITKELTDKEIWDDLTRLIKKLETIQTKDFHSRPKLIQLLKDLKTIRNKFSRTVKK